MAKDNGLQFEIGDTVVYPARGTGIVTDITELKRNGGSKKYYNIQFIDRPETTLMLPVGTAEERGVRPTAGQRKLKRVWSRLRDEPEKLPSNYKSRHKMVRTQLHSGDIMEIAKAVRDMAWRQQNTKKGLTNRGRRLYQKGLTLLAEEVAAIKDIDLPDARSRIWDRLEEHTESTV
jgi:RNA polymerase-interacting CarD/CdnL/TRCF family regulator